MRPLTALLLGKGGCCRDDAELAQLPAVGYAPQTTTTSVLKCAVARVSLGGFQGQYVGEGFDEQLFVRLRAASWQGRRCLPGSWASGGFVGATSICWQ